MNHLKQEGINSFKLTIAGNPTDMSKKDIIKLIENYGLKNDCDLYLRYIENEVNNFYFNSDLVILHIKNLSKWCFTHGYEL